MVKEIIKFLNSDKTILYPTDTVWGIGCDATSDRAVQKIYRLKRREESKALIVLVSSIEMLKEYVSISKGIIDYIKTISTPTTIIYTNPIGLSENLINKQDNSVAIRIVSDGFCNELISKYGKPIVSTSANISGTDTPKSFLEIQPDILNRIDYIVSLQSQKSNNTPSKIIKILDDKIVVLRS